MAIFLSKNVKSVTSKHTCGNSLLKKKAQSELSLRKKKSSLENLNSCLLAIFRQKKHYVASLVALLKTKNLLWSPNALASTMMRTTNIIDYNGKPFLA